MYSNNANSNHITMTSNTKQPVTCQILVQDVNDDLGHALCTVEMRSSDPSQLMSNANLFTAWLAANWDELFLMFRAQLTAHMQERTGAAPVQAKTSGPRILAADGKSALSSETTQPDLFDQAVTDVITTSQQALLTDDAPVVTPYVAPAYYESPVAAPDTSSYCGSDNGSSFSFDTSSSSSFDTSSSCGSLGGN
jgi:hypothetical protein